MMKTMICAWRNLQRDTIMRTMISLVVFVILIYPVCSTSYCTKKMSEERFREKTIKYPCKQAYQSRCSFFSFSYCTFYRNYVCDRSVNESYTYYYADKICCFGWTMMPNRTCVPTVSTLTQSSEDNMSKMTIGVYAGIATAVLLVIVVSALVVVRVMKRRRQKQFVVNEHLHAEQKIALKIMNNQENEENQRQA